MIYLFTYIAAQLPEIKNYEDIGLKSFLIFLILVLLLAMYNLWKKGNTLADEKSEMQDTFRREILDITEKSFSVISSQREELMANHGQLSEKTVAVITKGQDDIKRLLEKVSERLNK